MAAGVEHELEISRSRFRCLLAPAADEPAARNVIAARRRAHWDASHNCTAFVVGPAADTQGSHDDGEPSGTAGVPMLEVLRRRELTNVVAVVTRWFGGSKLGSGGLVRAYGHAVSAACDRAEVVTWHALRTVSVTVDYTQVGRLEHELRGAGTPILDAAYGPNARLDVAVDPGELEAFTARMAELTGGQAILTTGDLAYHPGPT